MPRRRTPRPAGTFAARHLRVPATGSTPCRWAWPGRCSPGSTRRCSGVGGGIIKVPVMHLLMGVPLRVSTATSNMMMGITATASAVIYLLRDEIDPFVAGPIALGVFLGASIGSAGGAPGRRARAALAVHRRARLHGLRDDPQGPRAVSGVPAGGRDTAYAMEARRSAACWSLGTWLAMALMLVGVILMLASGRGPAGPRSRPAVRAGPDSGRSSPPCGPPGSCGRASC